jgi:hypothetical protein
MRVIQRFGQPELGSKELAPGEHLLAEFNAACHGVFTIMTEGLAFVTDRRMIWLGDQLLPGHGPRVTIPFSDIKRCVLKEPRSAWRHSELLISLRGFKRYSFHAGSRGHVQISETLSAFPIHRLLREGDLTRQLFEALQAAIAAAIDSATLTTPDHPEFIVE